MKTKYVDPSKVDADTLIALMMGSGYGSEMTEKAEAMVRSWSHEDQVAVAEYVKADSLICSDHKRIKLPPKPQCMNGLFS